MKQKLVELLTENAWPAFNDGPVLSDEWVNHMASAIVAKLPELVQPLEIAEQYANPVIETGFLDYTIVPNPCHRDHSTIEFFGNQVDMKKFVVKFGGLMVAQTDDASGFLKIAQAHYTAQIMKALRVSS